MEQISCKEVGNNGNGEKKREKGGKKRQGKGGGTFARAALMSRDRILS